MSSFYDSDALLDSLSSSCCLWAVTVFFFLFAKPKGNPWGRPNTWMQLWWKSCLERIWHLSCQLCLWGFYRAGHIVTSPCAIAAQYLRRVCFDSGHCWKGYSNIGFIHSNIFWFQAVAFGSQDHIPFTAFLSFLFDSWISLVDHLWCFITKDMGSEITNKHALPVFSHSSPLVHCFRKKTVALGLFSLVPSHSWFHIVLFLPTGWTIYITKAS